MTTHERIYNCGEKREREMTCKCFGKARKKKFGASRRSMNAKMGNP
jgi:hypothetical protein